MEQDKVDEKGAGGESVSNRLLDGAVASKKPLPMLNLRFECDRYAIQISAEASIEAVNFALAALQTFKRSYFSEQEEAV